MTKVDHIAVKSTDLLLKLKVDSTFAEEFNELVVMTTDAIALLDNASFEQAGTKVGLDQLRSPVRVESTRINLDRLES